MSRDGAILAGVIGVVLVLALVVGAGLGAFGTTVTVSESESPSIVLDPPADGSSGVVFDLRARSAGKFLFIQYRRAEHHAVVAVVVPPECVTTSDSGAEQLRDDGPCADLPVRGEIAGGGTLGTGLEFFFVEVPVSRECFEALAPGDDWPMDSGPCAGE